MIQKVLRNGKERIFLVEEVESGYEGTICYVSKIDQTLTVHKTKQLKALGDIYKPNIFRTSFDRIILALHTKHVATIESSISVPRVHPDVLITEGELDGLLFHALWSFLNKFRPLAAKKLNTAELDLVIANIAIFGVKLQGHTVFNPLDFSGKEIEFFFRVSFISRSLLLPLEKIAKQSHTGPIVVERGAIFAGSIAKPGILFVVDKTNTSWYEMGNECGFRESFHWGFGDIYNALGNTFGVSSHYSTRIINKFSSHRISLRIQNIIEKVIRDEYKKFKEQADISLKSEHHELLRGEGKTVYFEDTLISSLFVSDERYKILDNPSLLSSLVLFPYIHPQYEYLNQLLRRRAKWLVPLNNK